MNYIKDKFAAFAIWLLWSLAIVALAGCGGSYDGTDPSLTADAALADAGIDPCAAPVLAPGVPRPEARKCGPAPERTKVDAGTGSP